MAQNLAGKKVLVLVSNGVDEAAISTAHRELLKEGAAVKVVGTEPGLVNSWGDNVWGLYFPVDIQISQVLGADFDLLVVPSGTRSTAKLAANPHTDRIISSFIASRKPMCFMGNAAELVARTGAQGSHIMAGECAGEIPAFVQKMIAHFVGDEVLSVAGDETMPLAA